MNTLSGKRWNKLEDDIVTELDAFAKRVEEFLLADGYPYGFELATEREEYEKLVLWKLTDDPRYWEDPIAVGRLNELQLRYGAVQDSILGGL